MADMLADGMAWLADKLKEHASREVVYKRGAAKATINATIGRTLQNIDDGQGGVRTEFTDRDYLIKAEDLILFNRLAEPERGDVIEETIGGKKHAWQVLSESDDPPWRWSDPYRVMYRIRTKYVGCGC